MSERARRGVACWSLVGAAVAALGCASTGPAPATSPPVASAQPAAPATPAPAPSGGDGALGDRDARYKAAFDRGIELYRSGDGKGALRAFDEAKEINARSPAAYAASGSVLRALGQPEAAAPEYKRALELTAIDDAETRKALLDMIDKETSRAESDEEQGLLDKAFQATEDKRPKDALPFLRRALDLNPHNVRTRYEIGYALIELGRMDEAIPQYEEARKLNPVHAEVLRELQYCYSDRKRFAELRGVVADRILVEGETPSLLQEVGFAYAASGNTTMAISTLENNLQRFPEFFPSHLTLADLYCAGKDEPKAQAHLTAFLAGARTALAKGDAEHLLMSRKKLETLVHEAEARPKTCAK